MLLHIWVKFIFSKSLARKSIILKEICVSTYPAWLQTIPRSPNPFLRLEQIGCCMLALCAWQLIPHVPHKQKLPVRKRSLQGTQGVRMASDAAWLQFTPWSPQKNQDCSGAVAELAIPRPSTFLLPSFLPFFPLFRRLWFLPRKVSEARRKRGEIVVDCLSVNVTTN